MPELEIKSKYAIILAPDGESIGIRLEDITTVHFPNKKRDMEHDGYEVNVYIDITLVYNYTFKTFDEAYEFGTELLLTANDGVEELPTFDAREARVR